MRRRVSSRNPKKIKESWNLKGHLLSNLVIALGKNMGFRRGTRELLRKTPRKRGMAPLGRYLQDFEVGDRVDILIDPSEHKAMPHSRFHGKTGIIVAKRGRCYEVKVKQIEKMKTIFASVAHLRKNALSDQLKKQNA